MIVSFGFGSDLRIHRVEACPTKRSMRLWVQSLMKAGIGMVRLTRKRNEGTKFRRWTINNAIFVDMYLNTLARSHQ